MEDGLRPEKSTGYSQPTKTGKESASARQESTANKKVLPVSSNAPSMGASSTSTALVSLSKILAIQIMMGDFKALKHELPASRQSSGNGKIYWSAEMPGHILEIEGENLLVDGKPVDLIVKEILGDE